MNAVLLRPLPFPEPDRLVRVSSMLLPLVGAALGLVIGVWGARALIAVSPGDLPRAQELADVSLLSAILD